MHPVRQHLLSLQLRLLPAEELARELIELVIIWAAILLVKLFELI